MLLEARRAFSREFIPRPTAMFGSPAKWEAFARRRPGFREAIPRLHHLMERAFIRSLHDPSPQDRAVFYLGRLCVEDFLEILLVCGNGYGIAGKKLLRGLFERALTAWHLHRHPDEAEDFQDHWQIQLHQIARDAQEMFGDDVISKEMLAILKEGADSVRDRFKVPICEKCKTSRVNHTWTRLDVVSMARACPEMQGYLLPGYRDTLAHVHANFGGIVQRLEITEDSITFGDETPPGVDDAVLTAAHAIVLQALRLQVEHFKLKELEGELETCAKDHKMVWESRRPTR